MNDRLKRLRSILKLSQEEFGKKINLSKPTISALENATRSLTDRVISDICTTFNVNERWLRNGEEPIFIQPEAFSLDEYVKKRGASELELEIMRAYFSMEPELRQSVISHFKTHLGQTRAGTDGHDELAATIAVRPVANDTKLTVEQKKHIVMTELPNEEKGQTSSVFTGGNGLGEKLA